MVGIISNVVVARQHSILLSGCSPWSPCLVRLARELRYPAPISRRTINREARFARRAQSAPSERILQPTHFIDEVWNGFQGGGDAHRAVANRQAGLLRPQSPQERRRR